jgi:hypothetical protein
MRSLSLILDEYRTGKPEALGVVEGREGHLARTICNVGWRGPQKGLTGVCGGGIAGKPQLLPLAERQWFNLSALPTELLATQQDRMPTPPLPPPFLRLPFKP